MRLRHYPKEKLAKELQAIFSKHLDMSQYKVFVFGSRVSGRGDDRSDIDIGIEGSNAVPDKIMAAIKEELEELPTLYRIDVVDFKTASPSFKQVALENIEPLAAIF